MINPDALKLVPTPIACYIWGIGCWLGYGSLGETMYGDDLDLHFEDIGYRLAYGSLGEMPYGGDADDAEQ